MFESIVLKIKKDSYRKYSEAFSFFQSKPINMIIGSRKLQYVIHFRDLEFMGDQTEYFKRYYTSLETITRFRKLINYYEMNMTPPIPNLLPIHNYHIIETRYKKHLKLCMQKEKSMAEHSDDEQSGSTSDHYILSLLNLTNLSEDSSEKEEDSEHDSFDSEPHYAFHLDNLTDDFQQGSRTRMKDEDMANGQLVIDFRARGEEMPSTRLLLQKKVQMPTVSIGIQTLPLQIELKKSESGKYKNEDQVGTPPELKKQTLWSPGQGQLKSSILLTESIEIRKSQKKKETFMQYYNSIPVKNPSNILERYIKRKK